MYSEDQAARALHRAARLQAEAAERLTGALNMEDRASEEGFERGELVEAAGEAGIDRSYVELALAELDAGTGAALELSHERGAARWLGTSRRSLVLSRVFEGEPAPIWDVLVEVLGAKTSGIELGKIEGPHPAKGGIAEFVVVPFSRAVTQAGGYTDLGYRMHQLELEFVRVQLRAMGGATRVTISVDLRPGVRPNLKAARISTGVITLIVGGITTSIALALGAPFAVGIGGLSLLGVGSGGMSLWRWGYPRAITKVERELEALLDKLDGALTLARG